MNNAKLAAVPALTIRRTFKATRERVFAAWTDPKVLAAWFCPEGGTLDKVECDARQGGRYRIAMRNAEGEEYIVGGVYSEVRKPERLAFTFRWVEDDPALERDTYVTIEFAERGGETEMIFTHEGFADEASRGRHEGGWTSFFEKMPAALV